MQTGLLQACFPPGGGAFPTGWCKADNPGDGWDRCSKVRGTVPSYIGTVPGGPGWCIFVLFSDSPAAVLYMLATTAFGHKTFLLMKHKRKGYNLEGKSIIKGF